MDKHTLVSDALDASRDAALIENTAQSIHKHLEHLEHSREEHLSRWIWELLQNARDAAKSDGDLKVSVVVDNKSLIISHNGRPFSNAEITHLIYHGSSKAMSSEDLGRFGSGFISTHLISRRINVKGVHESGKSFDFFLDRSGSNADLICAAMENSWDEFKSSLSSDIDANIAEYSTAYVYEITPDVEDLIKNGIDQLLEVVPFILAFNKKLATIEVRQNDAVCMLQRKDELLSPDGLRTIDVEEKSGDLQHSRLRRVALIEGDAIQVAWLLEESDGRWQVSMAPDVPRLFLAFPLLGTRGFPFPGILNGTEFTPNEERDGVYLFTGDDDANNTNATILKRGYRLAAQMVCHASKQNWRGMASQISIHAITDRSWLNKDRCKEVVREYWANPIRDLTVVENMGGEFIPLKHAIIPIHSHSPENLWEKCALLGDLRPFMPRKEDLELWSKWVQTAAEYTQIAIGDLNEAFTLEKLAQKVEDLGTLLLLQEALDEGVNSVQWLNELHRMILDCKKERLFDENKIIPDQTGKLSFRRELKVDKNVDDYLKDIGDLLGISVRSHLLHKECVEVDSVGLLENISNEDIFEHIKRDVETKTKQNPQDESVRSANCKLFSWMLSSGKWSSLEGYPVLTLVKDGSEKATIPLPSRGEQKRRIPMAPVNVWPEHARDYVDLFPRFSVMSEAYMDQVIESSHWEDLEARGLILSGPLYRTKMKVESFLYSEEAAWDDSVTDHRSTEAEEMSALAFLQIEGGVIDAVRKSKEKTVRFIEFLAKSVAPEDGIAFQIAETLCECGEVHKFYRGSWLSKLAKRKWMPIEGGRSVSPSAETLAVILIERPDLVKVLGVSPAADMLTALNISVADFLLRTVSDDEGKRISLARSMATLLHAAGGNEIRLEEFVDCVGEDPELLMVAMERKKQKEKVRENQRIGELVETLLKQTWEMEGFAVTRTGIGSDYEVEQDLIEDGEEKLLELSGGNQSVLVEIKSTGSGDVRMTRAQARCATENTKRFVLCCVPLDGRELDVEYIREVAIFVSDIGQSISPVFSEYRDLEDIKSAAYTTTGAGIEVEITEGAPRFRVSHDVWGKGEKLDGFKRYIAARITSA